MKFLFLELCLFTTLDRLFELAHKSFFYLYGSYSSLKIYCYQYVNIVPSALGIKGQRDNHKL